MYEFSEIDLFNKWTVMKFATEVQDQRDKKDDDLEKKKMKYEQSLKDEQLTFEGSIKEMDENIEACINFTEPRMYEKQADLITT